jgi:outer membrane usher protein
MGYLMDKEYYGVMPTYKSGVLIDLQIQRKIMVKGRLKLQNGTALSLVAGDIMNAQGQLVDNTFFTNRSGEFVIEGLAPGEYTIITDRKDLKSLRLIVKDDVNNSVHVGDLVVAKESK